MEKRNDLRNNFVILKKRRYKTCLQIGVPERKDVTPSLQRKILAQKLTGQQARCLKIITGPYDFLPVLPVRCGYIRSCRVGKMAPDSRTGGGKHCTGPPDWSNR